MWEGRPIFINLPHHQTKSSCLLWCKIELHPFITKPFPKQQILDFSKLKNFADDNFKFDEKAESSHTGKKTLLEKEKLLMFSHDDFRTLLQQTHKNQGLFGKKLTLYQTTNFRLLDPKLKSLQTTILNLMKMAESYPDV